MEGREWVSLGGVVLAQGPAATEEAVWGDIMAQQALRACGLLTQKSPTQLSMANTSQGHHVTTLH